METFIAQIVFIHTAQKNKLKKHERVCNDYDYHVDMPNEDNKIQPWTKTIKSFVYDLC